MTDSQQSYADKMRAQGKFTISLGFRSLHFGQLDGFMMHGERTGGKLRNVDPTRKHLNTVCIVMGQPATEASRKIDVAATLQEEALLAAMKNKASLVEGLRVNMRLKKKSLAALLAGPQPAWHRTKTSQGPLREGNLTVHRDWFLADDECPPKQRVRFLNDKGVWVEHDKRKYDLFMEVGSKFLLETFGDAVKFARFDGDEQSGHLQFILAHTVDYEPSQRYSKGRTMFVPSAHPNLANRTEVQTIGGKRAPVQITGYEHAQNLAGAFFESLEFAHLNIVRAEPKAAMIREASHMIETERRAMQEEFETDPLFSAPVPDGAPIAVDQFLLQRAHARQDAERLLSEKKGKKVRGMAAGTWALDYLEALGVVTQEERKTHHTRRAQDELLLTFQGTFGTVEEMMSDPDAVAAKAVELARERIASEVQKSAGERALADAEAARTRAEDKAAADARIKAEEVAANARIAAQEKAATVALATRIKSDEEAAAKARTRADEAAATERKRLDDEAAARRKAASIKAREIRETLALSLQTRETRVEDREAEIGTKIAAAEVQAEGIIAAAMSKAQTMITEAERKGRELVETLKVWFPIYDKIRAFAAKRPELMQDKEVAAMLKEEHKHRDLIDRSGGRERTR